MRNLLLTLKFNGTAYHGWQVQGDTPTVQKSLQDAIEMIFGKRENITGCSRTDAGVHANMYCCNIRTDNEMPCNKVISALNGNLPYDIVVNKCCEVSENFHARYDCKSKEYIYKIWNADERNPFLLNYALHYKYPLDVEYLNKQAQSFLGKHDFSAFCSAGSDVKDTVRTVLDIGLVRNGDEVTFFVEADGFLYNMVRIMVGTLIEISQKKIEADSIEQIIGSKKRENAGITAPPCGLYLNNVRY